MIRFERVHKRFGSVIAVEDVSFTAHNGQITGLLGHNGAGKTTCMRMLSGLIRPDRGSVFIDEHDVLRDPNQARQHLGVLPDALGLYPRLTAREHLQYFGELRGMSGPGLESAVEGLLDQLDMRSIADRRTEGFSQGERMKVALGRSLIHRPLNIVLDEPTNGLDVMSTRATRALLQSLRDEGLCVLLSSHIMQEVSALCDTIVVIAEGQTIAQGPLDELREQAGCEHLEDVFVTLTQGGRER